MKNIIILTFSLLIYGCQEPQSFRFVLFSDTHISEFGTGSADLRLAVHDVNDADGIRFVLVSGDITDTNTGKNLNIAKQILDSLEIPYYIIPGNHDTKWSGSAGANFRALWGDDKFSFFYSGYRFIGFHQGPVLRMDDGHIPRDVLDWLRKELRAAGQNQPVILLMHYALTPSVDNWYECVDVIRDYDIRAIIHGHGHSNRVTEYQGIPAVMGRSTLRAGAERGGYTVFDIRNDSLYAREKITGGPLSAPWARISLAHKIDIQAAPDSLLPDYSMNQQYSDLRIFWSFKGGYTMTASPVLDEDRVYAGDASGTMYALVLQTGEILWQYTCNGAIYGTAAVSEEKLIFTAADSMIYCLDKTDGALIWNFRTGDALVSVPVIEEDVVYIGASDGIFRALDLRHGETVWEFTGIGGYVETKPLLFNTLVIFGAWDGRLYALDKETGKEIWIWESPNKNPLYSPAACWPVAADAKVFFAAPDRFLRALDSKSGKIIWQDNRWKFRETVGLSEDRRRVYARSMTDSVVAFNTNPDSPEIVWAGNFSYGYDIAPSMPIEKEGTLFWGTKNGLIVACDAEDGSLQWKYRYRNYLINTVAPVSSDRVLFSNIDGDVILLGRE